MEMERKTEETVRKEIRRGDIFYITKYPTYGSEQRPARPAIVVSNDVCNAKSDVVEVVYLTTRKKPAMPTHVEIWCNGRRSLALCEQISSVAVDRLGGLKCHATPDEMLLIDQALATSVGIAARKEPGEKFLEHWYPDDERMLALVCLKYLQKVLGKSFLQDMTDMKETSSED